MSTKFLKFSKMQTAGNDFIVIDCFNGQHCDDLLVLARKLCLRHFGIGADQLLLLLPSTVADFKLRIFNQDGSEAEMCGNGLCCVTKHWLEKKTMTRETVHVETLAGIITARAKGDMMEIDLGEPILKAADIPVKETGEIVNQPLIISDREFHITCVSIGNPHTVILLSSLEDFPIAKYAPFIETHPMFPRRTNVEFVQVISDTEIQVRVWERGAGETLACGSGAAASVVAMLLNDKIQPEATVYLPGGKLNVYWNQENNRIYLTGKGEKVFEGKIKCD